MSAPTTTDLLTDGTADESDKGRQRHTTPVDILVELSRRQIVLKSYGETMGEVRPRIKDALRTSLLQAEDTPSSITSSSSTQVRRHLEQVAPGIFVALSPDHAPRHVLTFDNTSRLSEGGEMLGKLLRKFEDPTMLDRMTDEEFAELVTDWKRIFGSALKEDTS